MGLFDGLTGIAAAVLGDPVTYTPAGGQAREVQSILRRRPVTATGEDGVDMLIGATSWRVRQDLVPEIARDDRVALNGRTWRVVNVWRPGPVPADSHLICELEDLE